MKKNALSMTINYQLLSNVISIKSKAFAMPDLDFSSYFDFIISKHNLSIDSDNNKVKFEVRSAVPLPNPRN